MKPWLVKSLGCLLAVGIVAPAVVAYRTQYDSHKRLRAVAPGKLYRSGQMTVEGFTDAVERYGIKTIVNVQDELPDPPIQKSTFDRGVVGEQELCRRLGVRYVHLAPDLRSDRNNPEATPEVITQWLAVIDDPANYPILLHCRAGLHRTGVLSAVYRMEYEGWDHASAAEELRANGFGDMACTAANDYVRQYVINYRPRRARHAGAE